jgi:uncharacterized membrane-anchored protein YitT (DUF2179 family)
MELKCWLYGITGIIEYRFCTFLLAVNVVIINIAAFVFSLEKAMLSLAVYYIVANPV